MLPLIESLPTQKLHPAALPGCAIDALYVHVPFCFHKCHYCDFYSIAGQSDERMNAFVDTLLREAELWRDGFADGIRPTTVFFGGGTPSLLPIDAMRRLIDELGDRFDLSVVDEFTVEVNPATGDDAYFAMLRDAGVTRISLGAQSFNRDELAALERHHDPADVGETIAQLRAAGFERINLDLIYAIPGQTLASWDASLAAALGFGLEHLSCYALTYEPETPLAVKKKLGRIRAAEESLELEMLRHTRQTLAAAGLPAYEISNHARPGAECRHNLAYWHGRNYIGLGPSAASHLAGTRFKLLPRLTDWHNAIAAGQLPAADVEHLTPSQRANELAYLKLRTARGIDPADFADRTGFDFASRYADEISMLSAAGLARFGSTFHLTEAGVEKADAIAGQFLAVQ